MRNAAQLSQAFSGSCVPSRHMRSRGEKEAIKRSCPGLIHSPQTQVVQRLQRAAVDAPPHAAALQHQAQLAAVCPRARRAACSHPLAQQLQHGVGRLGGGFGGGAGEEEGGAGCWLWEESLGRRLAGRSCSCLWRW